MLAMTKTKKT